MSRKDARRTGKPFRHNHCRSKCTESAGDGHGAWLEQREVLVVKIAAAERRCDPLWRWFTQSISWYQHRRRKLIRSGRWGQRLELEHRMARRIRHMIEQETK